MRKPGRSRWAHPLVRPCVRVCARLPVTFRCSRAGIIATKNLIDNKMKFCGMINSLGERSFLQDQDLTLRESMTRKKEGYNARKFATEDNKVVKGIKRYEGGEEAKAAADKKGKTSRKNSSAGLSKKERKRKNSSAGKDVTEPEPQSGLPGERPDVEAPVAAEVRNAAACVSPGRRRIVSPALCRRPRMTRRQHCEPSTPLVCPFCFACFRPDRTPKKTLSMLQGGGAGQGGEAVNAAANARSRARCTAE